MRPNLIRHGTYYQERKSRGGCMCWYEPIKNYSVVGRVVGGKLVNPPTPCLLSTSESTDDRSSVSHDG